MVLFKSHKKETQIILVAVQEKVFVWLGLKTVCTQWIKATFEIVFRSTLI